MQMLFHVPYSFVCHKYTLRAINREYYWYSSLYSHIHELACADCPAQSFSDFRLRELCIALTVCLAPNLFLIFDMLIFLVRISFESHILS